MREAERELVRRLSAVGSVVEIGVGNRHSVAAALAGRGVDVTATDIRERSVPEGVKFVLDDVTEPTLSVYDGADIIFARNLPPELQRAARDLARRIGADCWFTTLGGDPVVVPATSEQLPSGITLYRTVEERDSG